MEPVTQTLEEILGSLTELRVDWRDATAQRVIEQLEAFPVKGTYAPEDVRELLDAGFKDGLLVCRLFLGMSKDVFEAAMAGALGAGEAGAKGYGRSPDRFVAALVSLGLVDAMEAEANRILKWSDTLVERLRSGRGSAIAGQKRGRGVEDFAEEIVRRVFGDNAYAKRCAFTGKGGQTAKCDFAISSAAAPRVVVEAKGYGATGSKMTDIIGDIEKIIRVKRSDTAFLFFTDGLTWKQRKSDLGKIVRYQNEGDIERIYTYAMVGRFEQDLSRLKQEKGL